jgi:hypothetical protein
MTCHRRERDRAWNVRLLVIGTLAIWSFVVDVGRAEEAQLAVTLGGCTDCHTPGHFFGNPDLTRFLGGSDVGFAIPGFGTFVGRNLTPDKETGLG